MSEQDSRTVSIGEWIIVLIVTAIPVVNVVFYLIWAYAPGVPGSKRNYARAVIYVCLFTVLVLLVVSAFGSGLRH